jgi:serine/threonine protein kinase
MSYMSEGRLLTNTATRTPAPVVEDFFIMEDALVHYKLMEKLGKGSFGNVYIAKLRKDKTGRRFAVKKSLIDSKRRMQTMCREIGNLRNANHRNIVQFIASYFHKDVAWIVMEYCDAGTLRDLRYCTTLKEPHIAYIMREMLLGLEYMHVNGMMHRDIKGENVLLSADGDVKVADLGLAVPAQEDQKRIAGSKYWMAPEMILAAGYGPKADIYSLGCTAYELADGLPPYAQHSAIRALFCAAKFGFPPLDCPAAWSRDFLDFLTICTHPNPRDRPSCTELLQHPFLNKACSKSDFAKIIAAAFTMEAYGFDF